MSAQANIQVVKDAFAAIGRGDHQGLLALSAQDIEWITPGEDWPLAGTYDWVFAVTVRNGKVTHLREYLDTQALARASAPWR